MGPGPVPAMGRSAMWQVAAQSFVLKWLIRCACLHTEVVGIEVGYKTACTVYETNRNVCKAALASSMACVRLGLIAGCGYAVSALHVNAALAAARVWLLSYLSVQSE